MAACAWQPAMATGGMNAYPGGTGTGFGNGNR